jgi:8-oxo-dGTP pyrophosphatase MutT (NUDIX family)
VILVWRPLASRVVYENAWMTVHEDEVIRPDGSAGIYGYIEKPDFALVVPLDDDRYVLVQQYRYPIKSRSWEFPQGSWEQREWADASELARGELREETGLEARELSPLGRLFEACALSTHAFEVFLAQGLVQSTPERSPEESDLTVASFTRDEVDTMIRDGLIRDAATVAALALVDLANRRNE